MTTASALRVEMDGAPLPADLEPLLAAAYVDDSLRLPDLFELRFRDPARMVVEKSGCRIGSTVTLSVLVAV